MTDSRIHLSLQSVAARSWRLECLRVSAFIWGILAAIGSLFWYLQTTGVWSSRWTLAALCVAAVIGPWLVLRSRRRQWVDLHAVATRIEQEYPTLDSRLLAAMEQQPQLPENRLNYLQETLIRQALKQGGQRGWERMAPVRSQLLTFTACLTALATLAICGVGLAMTTPPRLEVQVVTDNTAAPPESLGIQIEPGDTEIERGSSLQVMVRFQKEFPFEVTLHHQGETAIDQQVTMSQSLDDPVFASRLSNVQQDLVYHVAYPGWQSPRYRVRVFDYPALQQADAKLVFPSYTGLPEKQVADVRRLTAVEGTQVTLAMYLNKPITSGHLRDGDDNEIPLVSTPANPHMYIVQMPLETSGRYRLHLVDDQQRNNKFPPEFVFRATPNQTPKLTIKHPGRDVLVSPLEELHVKADAWDDFGLTELGLTYNLAGQEPHEIIFNERSSQDRQQSLDQLLAMEDLNAEPDQLLSFHLWAQDIGPDGQPRKTYSDMYFAEVRPFDEIYRSAPSPPGGQSQQQGNSQQQSPGGASEELGELQKQIINGTWKLQRQVGIRSKPDTWEADATVLRDAQQTALDQLSAVGAAIEDASAAADVEAIQKHMTAAIDHLTKATQADADQIEAQLKTALQEEQAAYQGLLRLRAREHQVSRQNSQGGRSSSARGASSRFQQQLEQLELANTDNRYETQSQAQPQTQQDAQQREDRQILNRLRELARRQEDLNDRIKEMQSALQEAANEAEQEEIQKQLQRLRDQQQEILRDTDELSSRMQQPENLPRMSEAQEQLEEARQNLTQSSEALQEGQVSQAAASATRAERDFKELREEFRQSTAERFSDAMKQMREDARELTKNEQAIAQELESLDDPNSRSLRDSPQRDELEENLAEQEADIDKLLQRMEETVTEADETEPLLSNQLYDTLRDTRQGRLQDAVRSTRELIEQGFLDNARNAEEVARGELEKLQEGVEKAAESVLGDETAGLRRALDEVRELQEQLEGEITRAAGPPPNSDSQEPDDSDVTEPQQGQPQQGQPQQGQPQQGQPQQGQPQQGQTQQGQTRGLGQFQEFLEGRRTNAAPLTGGDFREWSDRLRDVEEMVDAPDLRSQATQIRERARSVRVDLKRHAREPDWEKIRLSILQPLVELQDQIKNELLRLESKEAQVPLDRDPVPPRFSERVREYYQRLGSGQ